MGWKGQSGATVKKTDKRTVERTVACDSQKDSPKDRQKGRSKRQSKRQSKGQSKRQSLTTDVARGRNRGSDLVSSRPIGGERERGREGSPIGMRLEKRKKKKKENKRESVNRGLLASDKEKTIARSKTDNAVESDEACITNRRKEEGNEVENKGLILMGEKERKKTEKVWLEGQRLDERRSVRNERKNTNRDTDESVNHGPKENGKKSK